MWNYSYIFPSFLILIVFVLYCFYIPRVKIGLNKAYIQLIVVEGIVMLADIASSKVDENFQAFAPWQLYLVNDIYFIFFFVRGYLFYAITVCILKLQRYFKETLYWAMAVPLFVDIILTVFSRFTHFVYYIAEDGYHSGPLYNYVIYTCMAFYIGACFILVFIHKKNFTHDTQFIGALGYIIVLFIGAVLRRALPTYLLMDTFCLIALIIMYLSFTNPVFFFDFKTSSFNANALRYYVDEIKSYKDNRYIAFGIHNYREMREVYGSRHVDKGLDLIGQYLKTSFTDLVHFYYREGRFVLIGNGKIDSNNIVDAINARFKQPWVLSDTQMYFEVDFVQTKENMSIESPERRLKAVLSRLGDREGTIPGEIIYVNDSDIEQIERTIIIRKTLKWVVQNELTEVYLQPIVRADNRQIVGAEALARIKDREGNRIMPGEFVPVAERNGAINQMGEQIFKKTCNYIKENDLEKMGILWINVNLSPMQFMNSSLVEKYNSIIEKSGIDVGLIHLEITEDAMVDQMLLTRQIQAMRENGFKFVLDDYGKGYSNLDRLKNIPFINVKIDMAIVRDYCKNPDSLLPNMIKTFKSMGFSITAEGIETEEMADTMYEIGCDYLQGYLFSPPVPMEEFADKLL